MSTLTVAKATVADVLELGRMRWVGIEAIYYDGAGFPTAERILAVAQRGRMLWVARSDDELVGYALARRLSDKLFHLAPVETDDREDSDSIATALLQDVYDTTGDDVTLSATVFSNQTIRMERLSGVGFKPLDEMAMSRGLDDFVRKEIAWWDQPEPATVLCC